MKQDIPDQKGSSAQPDYDIQLLTEVHFQMNPDASDDDIEKSVQDSLALWHDVNKRFQKIAVVHARVKNVWLIFREMNERVFGPFGAFDNALQENIYGIRLLLINLNGTADIDPPLRLTIEGYCKAMQNDFEAFANLMAQIINVEDILNERYAYALKSVASRRGRDPNGNSTLYENPRHIILNNLSEVFRLTDNNEFKPYVKYLFTLDPYRTIKLYALTLRNEKNKAALNELITSDTNTLEEKTAFRETLVGILQTPTGRFKRNDLWQHVPTDIKAWLKSSVNEEAELDKKARIEHLKKELHSMVEKLSPADREAFSHTLKEALKKLHPDLALHIDEEYASHSPTNSTQK